MKTAPPCSAADLDCDGLVGPTDIAILLGSWGPCGKSNCAADIDRDGTFTPGLDENEYKERAKIWGVRDIIGTINTTPLVDVMLVLLIIFLITIPVVTTVEEHALPDANRALQMLKADELQGTGVLVVS